MAKEKNAPPTLELKVSYSQSIKRIVFNRFKFSHANGVMCARVWYQDELMRASNAYAFVFSDEDFCVCKNNVKNYLQRVMQDSPVAPRNVSANAENCPVDIQTTDLVRMMMCSRSGGRAEIYLGFFPIAMTVSRTPSDALWKEVQMDVALCSDLECHIGLLRQFVEAI